MMMFDIVIYGSAILLAIIGSSVVTLLIGLIVAAVYSKGREFVKKQLSDYLDRKGNESKAGNFSQSGQTYTPSTTFRGNNTGDQFDRGIGGGKF